MTKHRHRHRPGLDAPARHDEHLRGLTPGHLRGTFSGHGHRVRSSSRALPGTRSTTSPTARCRRREVVVEPLTWPQVGGPVGGGVDVDGSVQAQCCMGQ